jgi:hypothetical protein
LSVYYTVQVYDISSYVLSGIFGNRHSLVSNTHYLIPDGTALDLPSYPNDREIDVTAQVTGTLSPGGRVPYDFCFLEGYFSPQYSLKWTTAKSPSFVDQIVNAYKAVDALAAQLGPKATEVINAIAANPAQFLNILVTGFGNAVQQFITNLPTSFGPKLEAWILGNSSLNGIASFDFSQPNAWTSFLLQYSGLTWDHITGVLQQQLGAGNLAAVSQVATMVQNFNPSQINNFLQSLPGINIQSIVNNMVTQATTQLATGLAEALPRLLAKFVPGVGIAQSLFQGIQFLINNAQSLGSVFTQFLNSLDALCAGDLTNAQGTGFQQQLLTALNGNAVTLFLNFAASQLGLSTLPLQLQKAVQFVPKQVDAALRAAVNKIVQSLVPNKTTTGKMAQEVPFTYPANGPTYVLWVAQNSYGVNVKVGKGAMPGTTFIGDLTASSFDNTVSPTATADINALINAAKAFVAAAKQAGGNFAALATQQAALTAAENVVVTDIKNNACKLLNAGCFAAGTKLWTPQGYRNVEDIQPGDLVFSRNEFDPEGAIEAKEVEARFERIGCILHLHVDGQVIRTTPEHPFFVYNTGWTQAGALAVGDWIGTQAGGWAQVEEVFDTELYEKVYNLRVADYHTYFVGDAGWDFAVWAHNAVCVAVDRTQLSYNPRTQGGYMVYGLAQNTTGAPGNPHAAQVTAILNSLIASGPPTGTYFVLNCSWRTALGRNNVDLGTAGAADRPDIIIVEPLGSGNWKVHAIEVLSGDQREPAARLQLQRDFASVNHWNGQIDGGLFAAVSQTDPSPVIAW